MVKIYRIGKLKLKSRFFLSPMLEPNDIAFRLLCKRCGCTLTYTGMISLLSKQKIFLDDRPAVQLFGNTEKGIKRFIQKNDKKVSLWDFNLGCPSKLSKRLSHGAFMHQDTEKIEKILNVMKQNTKKPISIKLRKSENAIKIAKIAEKYVDAIGIHPRTIAQGYSGKPDYEFAKRLKKKVNIPVIYSGDAGLNNIKHILKDFDFVFIGRTAIGNPGIFSQLENKKDAVDFEDYLEFALKYKLPFRQIKMQAMNFTKGMNYARKIRKRLSTSKDLKSVLKIIKDKN